MKTVRLLMKLKFYVILMCFIISCEEEHIYPVQHIKVFFDFSTSLNETNIRDQSKKVKELIEKLEFNTNLVIYPINLDINPEPIYAGQTQKYTGFYEDNTMSKNRKKMADSIEKLLIETYINQNKANEYTSCIISSFEVTYKFLPKKVDSLTKVFIFTDMVEQCEESRAGKLYMCSSSRTPSYEEIEEQIISNYNPEFSLNEKLGYNQLFVIKTSSYGNQSKCLNQLEQDKIWDLIFTKLGYDKPNNIYRHTNVPSEKELWGVQ